MKETNPLADFPRRHYETGKGVYSVCSAHPVALEAAIAQAVGDGGALLLEATSNQVDQFGGYTGMTPAQFRDWAAAAAARHGLPRERLILGGDHLGPNPWRREPAARAMEKARELVRQYAAAGFAKLHIDCSMALGGDAGPAPDLEAAAGRSAALCAVAEAAAREAGRPAPVYVVGTEVPIPGGVDHELDDSLRPTEVRDAMETLAAQEEAFRKAGLDGALERVIALVVQPGVEFGNYTVADYDAGKASGLSGFIGKRGDIVFEAHSTDYQTRRALSQMVRDHFAILKVGPWLTFAYREALFALSAIAGELGRYDGLRRVMEEAMLASPGHWQGHYHGTEAERRLGRAFSFSDRARYYWPDASIRRAVDRLFAELDGVDIPLSLLSQYLPRQYDFVRETGARPTPRDMALRAVMAVTGIFAGAAGLSGE